MYKQLHPSFRAIEFLCLTITVTIIIINIYLLSIHNIQETDLWLHLKTGQIINLQGPIHKDLYSWLINGEKWTDHSWLFQWLLFKLVKLFKLGIVFTLRFIPISLSIIIILTNLLKRRFPPSIISFALFISIIGSYKFITLRPVLFSLLFFSITLTQIYSFLENGKISSLFPTLLIYPIWVNMHGYFILEPILFFILLVTSPKQKDKIILILIYLLLLTIMSPYWLDTLLYPIKTIFQNLTTDKIFFSYIQELRPPIITIFSYKDIMLKITTFLYLLVIFLAKGKIDKFTIVTSSIIIISSFLTIRNSIFWFISYPLFLCPALKNAIDQMHCNYKNHKNHRIFTYFSLIPVISLILSGHTLKLIDQAKLKKFSYTFNKSYPNSYNIDYDLYPIAAVSFLSNIKFNGNVFNNLNTGAFLIYSLWPKTKIAIDGRTELYGAKLFDFLLEIVQTANLKRFNLLSNKYHIKAVIWDYYNDNTGDLFLYYLYKSKQWKLLYIDPTTIIFIKNNKGNSQYFSKAIPSPLKQLTEKMMQISKNNDLGIPLRVAILLSHLHSQQLASKLLNHLLEITSRNFSGKNETIQQYK